MTYDAHAIQGGPSLSFRQWQILGCLMRGYHNKTIANRLGIEVVTVKMHVGILFRKLGVSNRTEAAVRGIELLVDPTGSRIDLPEPEFSPRPERDRHDARVWR